MLLALQAVFKNTYFLDYKTHACQCFFCHFGDVALLANIKKKLALMATRLGKTIKTVEKTGLTVEMCLNL
jgi:hypothetical protein